MMQSFFGGGFIGVSCVYRTTFAYSHIIYYLCPTALTSLFPYGTMSKISAVCTGNPYSRQVETFITRCAHLPLLGWLVFIVYEQL